MRAAHLARHRWPKRHEFVVEQCPELHVSDLLPRLPDDARRRPVPEAVGDDDFGWFVLAPKCGGVCLRWWLICPQCRARRESLYLWPDSPPGEWKCRVCHGLIHASQRYGYRHRLRRDPRNWTARRRRGAAKSVARVERKLERSRRKQAATLAGVASDTSIDMEAIIEHGREVVLSIVRERQQAQEQAQRSLADALRAAVVPALAALERISREAPRKRDRDAAGRTLKRWAKRSEPPERPSSDSGPPARQTPCTPPLTREALERMMAVMAEMGEPIED